MGNKPVKIGLKLDQTKFEAGSVLTGRVYLSITGGERRAQGVHLLLMGQEISSVVHEENHGASSGSSRNHHDSSYTKVERSTTSLVHLDVPLTTFESGVVEPGQYEYPFEWELPMDLPGTMRCQKGDSHCEVSYQLTSYLYSGRSNSLWGGSTSPDASCSVNLCVTAKPNHVENKSIIMEPEEFPIRHCCANKGHIMLGWDTDSAVASPASSVRVVIIGSNASMVEVKHLRVRWMETVSWNARGQSESMERILDESIIPIVTRPEWQALQRLPHRRLFSSHHDATYASLYPSVFTGGNQHGEQSPQIQPQRLASSLNIPPDARDTYQGRLINVRHSLIVKAVTPGHCCITSPESCALVEVQRQPTACSSTATASVTATEEVTHVDDTWMRSSTGTAIVEPSAPIEDDVFVQANVLPADWSAQTADVITLTVPVDTSPPTRANVIPTAPHQESLLENGDFDSMEQLQQSLASSLDPAHLVQEDWIGNSTVVPLLQNATPHQYISLLQCLQHTPHMSAMPEVARAIALVMDTNFSCNHVLACLWALPPYLRFDVLKEVAPLAADLEKNQSQIEQQLDDTELLHFRAALR